MTEQKKAPPKRGSYKETRASEETDARTWIARQHIGGCRGRSNYPDIQAYRLGSTSSVAVGADLVVTIVPIITVVAIVPIIAVVPIITVTVVTVTTGTRG